MNNVELLKKHYLEQFKQYGDSAQGVQWSDVQTQEKRFEILLEIGCQEGDSLLDFGCGTGHLFEYLNKNNTKLNYTGVDILDEFLTTAKNKYPEAKFGQLIEFEKEKFDYIIISGVFNNKMDDNVGYYQEQLKKLFPMVNKGIAFNMMSAYVDYFDENLFYEKPENVFQFIKKEISPFVTIRNDYQIKPGVIPFEFCTYVYKK